MWWSNMNQSQIRWIFMALKGWCRFCSGFLPVNGRFSRVSNICCESTVEWIHHQDEKLLKKEMYFNYLNVIYYSVI